MRPLAKFAAILVFAAALFHFSVPMLSGFVSISLPQLVFAVLCVVLGMMMLKNKRWVMWLSFFVMLFGGIQGMAGYLSGSVIPDWASLGAWVVSWLAAACLFLVLWRDHVPGVVAQKG